MIIKRLFLSITFFLLLSFEVIANTNHLEQAIKNTEAAISAVNGAVIAEYAEIARIHATAVRKVANQESDFSKLDKSIKFLEDAVKKGNESNNEEAKKSSVNALDQLIQFEVN